MLVAVLATSTATGAGVLLSSREYVVLRLQRRSYANIWVRDMAKVGRLYSAMMPAAASTLIIFLGIYNGWNQLGLYTLFALTFLAGLLSACLVVHTGVLGLVHGTGILPALKGACPYAAPILRSTWCVCVCLCWS